MYMQFLKFLTADFAITGGLEEKRRPGQRTEIHLNKAETDLTKASSD